MLNGMEFKAVPVHFHFEIGEGIFNFKGDFLKDNEYLYGNLSIYNAFPEQNDGGDVIKHPTAEFVLYDEKLPESSELDASRETEIVFHRYHMTNKVFFKAIKSEDTHWLTFDGLKLSLIGEYENSVKQSPLGEEVEITTRSSGFTK
ncbi:hypothetical protein WH52_01385 [Tenacibaculum holothuriorum]|uniref:Uncharacterized protein n=2 Tax=Tenacibaculum holothuriorum TaxID=1635173 RepID=A0A1Y2PGN1_9FLAO|nr:hypothetical protein WH52_01385 [Tenacibaculum holothuriorum]